ncbi:dihydrolipoamide acetyltransferase family protein [Trichloromonas sp.]|uniref:dihydrolipoamide acetyltransferase family protein n=1 Tax=Trichloromonas sp. TaxID=3069249 RepID=UPI003D815DDD
MLTRIAMARFDDHMQEGTLVKWHIQEGNRVAPGDLVAEINTGSETIRIEASEAGEVVVLKVAEGETVPVGTLLAVIDRAPAPAEAVTAKPGKSVKVRRIIARKMVESWQTIPHFFVTVAIDMTDVIGLRKSIGVTVNDFVLAACVCSLKEHPWVNSLWIDGEAVEQPVINLAMAVATDRGLYYPVLADCGGLTLGGISRKAAELATKAHQGHLTQAEMAGGTFTVSNMGMLGVESFSAIITPPQAAVLAVGTIRGEVVVNDNGEPGVAPMLRLTLSADHRILDGADAADFLATVKSYLEAPVTLES